MKFITEKAQIVDSLQNAAAVAERRQTIPILANLRLKTVNGKLEVTATDLEIQIKTFSDLIEIQEEGEFDGFERGVPESNYRGPPSVVCGKHPPMTGDTVPTAIRMGRIQPRAVNDDKAVAVVPMVRQAHIVSAVRICVNM